MLTLAGVRYRFSLFRSPILQAEKISLWAVCPDEDELEEGLSMTITVPPASRMAWWTDEAAEAVGGSDTGPPPPDDDPLPGVMALAVIEGDW